MNPAPAITLIKKLIGCIIDSITFYRFQISISCAEGHRVVVCAPFCFGRGEMVQEMGWVEFPIVHSDMARILGYKITDASVDEGNFLRLTFSTNDVLLISWSSMYESYELHIEGERIIV